MRAPTNSQRSDRFAKFCLLLSLTLAGTLSLNLPVLAQSIGNPILGRPAPSPYAAVLEPLQQALDTKNWAVADRETRRILSPDSVSLKPLPEIKVTPDLIRAIDQAWLTASNGRFGLSVQARIWQEVKQNTKGDETAVVNAFRDRVGWKLTKQRTETDFLSSDWLNQSELNYSINAPVGHFPWAGVSDEVVQDLATPGEGEHCGSCTIDAMQLRDGRFYGAIPGLMARVRAALPATVDPTWRSPKVLHRLNLAAIYPKNSQVRPTHYTTTQYMTLAVASTDQNNRTAISLWNIASGKREDTVLAPAASHGTIETLYANPKHSYLWAGNAQGNLTVWNRNLYSDFKTKTWVAHAGGVTAIAMGSDPELVITGGRDRTVKIWNVKTGELRRTLRLTAGEVNASQVRSLQISPDQTRLAVATDRTIQLWNLQTGQLIKVAFQSPNINANLAHSMAFSQDGQFLATLDQDHSIKLWNASTGARSRTLRQHQISIEALSFTPNGQQLLSRDRDQFVLFWDLAKSRSDRSISVASGNAPKPIDTSDAIATPQPLIMSADGQTFAVPLKLSNSSLALDLRSVATGDRLTVLPGVSQASFTFDQKFLITQGDHLQIWRP